MYASGSYRIVFLPKLTDLRAARVYMYQLGSQHYNVQTPEHSKHYNFDCPETADTLADVRLLAKS